MASEAARPGHPSLSSGAVCSLPGVLSGIAWWCFPLTLKTHQSKDETVVTMGAVFVAPWSPMSCADIRTVHLAEVSPAGGRGTLCPVSDQNKPMPPC